MNIYVGNLSYRVTEEELRQAFESLGKVDTATIIKDKYSGESKGFGFVEMPSGDEARAAIEAMNGKELKGRALKVNEARPRSEHRRGGGGRSGFGSRGGRGGGNRGSFGGGGNRRRGPRGGRDY